MNSPESTMERDLRAIDDALAAARPRHPDLDVRELQELALALTADTPEPDPAFAAGLRERVEAGFPPPVGSWRARVAQTRARLRGMLRMPSARSLLPAGFAGMLVVALAVAVIALPDLGTSGGDDDSAGGGVALQEDAGGGATQGSAPEAAGGAGTAERRSRDAAIAPAPPSGGFAPNRSDRKIERSVSLELASPVDQMERVAERLTEITNRHGGFVLSSSLSTGDDGAGGDFDLRIPAAQLRPALRDISALATVRSQSQSGRDVTRQHVSAEDRLRAARAERASLLRRLETAETDEEAEALRRRLDLVAIEIRGLRAQLRDLRVRTNYATVTVALLAEDGDSGAGAGGFDDALDDAGDLLVGAAGVLIRVLALALPLGLLGLAGWFAASVLRRRRRESALV